MNVPRLTFNVHPAVTISMQTSIRYDTISAPASSQRTDLPGKMSNLIRLNWPVPKGGWHDSAQNVGVTPPLPIGKCHTVSMPWGVELELMRTNGQLYLANWHGWLLNCFTTVTFHNSQDVWAKAGDTWFANHESPWPNKNTHGSSKIYAWILPATAWG